MDFYNRDELIDRCLELSKKFDQLSLPTLRKVTIDVNLVSTETNPSIETLELLTKFAVQESDHLKANLLKLKLLNDVNGRKNYEILLEFKSDQEIEFKPGDSIGIDHLK